MAASKLFHVSRIMTVAAIIGLTSSLNAESIILLTPQEAALPKPLSSDLDLRGITRGPQVTLVSPAQDAAQLASPIHLRFKFESHGGSRIDADATRVTYMRTPPVDLTDRLRPFLQIDGLDIAEVVLPPGNHVIRIDIQDTDGRSFRALYTLNVIE